MDQEKFAIYKQYLLNEKKSLTERMAAINDKLKMSMPDSIGELSMYDNHPADTGDELFERGKDLSLRDAIGIQMQQVENALKKINEHSYGFCDRCGQVISEERLKAMPSANLCVKCKREEEVPDRTPRPIEEEVVRPPFGERWTGTFDRKFGDQDNDPPFDGEDAWQAVARFGTSNTPQDLGGESRAPYPNEYIDWDENIGFVNDVDSIPYRRDKDGMVYKDYRSGLREKDE
ncbi:MAG: TraR/DksA C4-type zinc finger protein [Bacillota bacterium]